MAAGRPRQVPLPLYGCRKLGNRLGNAATSAAAVHPERCPAITIFGTAPCRVRLGRLPLPAHKPDRDGPPAPFLPQTMPGTRCCNRTLRDGTPPIFIVSCPVFSIHGPSVPRPSGDLRPNTRFESRRNPAVVPLSVSDHTNHRACPPDRPPSKKSGTRLQCRIDYRDHVFWKSSFASHLTSPVMALRPTRRWYCSWRLLLSSSSESAAKTCPHRLQHTWDLESCGRASGSGRTSGRASGRASGSSCCGRGTASPDGAMRSLSPRYRMRSSYTFLRRPTARTVIPRLSFDILYMILSWPEWGWAK